MNSVQEKQIQLDKQLNRLALDLIAYSVIGYGVGIGFSLFFKRKANIRNMSAGLFAGYAFNDNHEQFNRLK